MINVRFPHYSFLSLENKNFFLVAGPQLFDEPKSDLYCVNVRKQFKLQRLFEQNKFLSQPFHHNLYVDANQSSPCFYFVISLSNSPSPLNLQTVLSALDHIYRICVELNITQLAISLRDLLKLCECACDEKLIFTVLDHLSSQVQFIFHQNKTKQITFYTDRSFEPEDLALVYKQKEQLKNIHIERSC